MQGPKKMAGGGIIAFAEGDPVPPAEEATSTVGDALRKAMQWFQTVGDPSKNPREIQAREIERASRIKPGPFEAVTPSERTRRENESAQILQTVRDKQARPAQSEAVKADAKKDDGKPTIQNVPDPTSGIAALMQSMGGSGGGSDISREESALRKQLLEGLNKQGPAQTEYIANARRVANELETARAPALSEAQREALEEKQYGKYQARSKPHFDMMQKLLDEERAANNAGKESEVYQMLGKMGGALMSSRGAFGPALGRAVGEGIDYSDKMDAARATAERLRRSAQMDLLKARMADEKNDQKSAQEYINEHDRKLQAAFKIDQDLKVGAMNIRGKMADLEAGDERSRERTLAQLSALDQKRELSNARSGFARDLALAKYGAQLDASRLKGLPTIAEHYKMKEAADSLFANPFQGEAAAYLSSIEPEGKNYIAKVQMMGMKPQEALKDPAVAAAVQKAKAAYINDVLRSTNRVNASSSSVRDGNELFASLPK